MKIRRAFAAAALSIGLVVGPAAVATAQDSPASVLPSVVERPTQVKGVQLPRTGSEIDGELLAGIGLTAAGAALALTARQRRRRFAEQL
jgi:LPXTG-motif cell wall-anchored protein